MAQRRLNKGLVAFLTVMGIALSVSIVAVATYQNAKKDPEVFAQMGRQLEEQGQHERAAEQFKRAYAVNKQVKYLIDASRCAYRIGLISEAISMLMQANSQAPDDVQVLEKLLEHLWELRNATRVWADLREYSEKLLAIQRDNPRALVYQSTALLNLAADEPGNLARADEALNRAVELAPNDPLVAMARAQREVEAASELFRKPDPRLSDSERDARVNERLRTAVEYLRGALAAEPQNVRLVIGVAELLQQLNDPAGALATLEEGRQRIPNDPDLLMACASARARKIAELRKARGAAGEPTSEEQQLRDEARALLARTIELEPALYDAYRLLARLIWPERDRPAPLSDDVRARADEALKILENAIATSAGVKSVRATLNMEGRALLHLDGFETAMVMASALSEPTQKEDAARRAREIFRQAKTLLPEWYVTDYMEGQLALMDGDFRAAIAGFEKARDKTGGRWLPPRERLAALYREVREYGLALKTIETVVASYQEMGQPPPAGLVADHAELLATVERAQEALNLADDGLRRYPDDERLLRVKAFALNALGRSEEARSLLAGAGGQSDALALQRAALAASAGDVDGAARAYREVLERNPEHVTAAAQLLRLLSDSGRRDEARAVRAELARGAKSEAMQRTLRTWEVVLATDDPKQRDARLLELIQSIEDPFDRAQELYAFYVQEERRDLERATAAMNEMARLRPDAPELVERQFTLALMREDYAEAEKLVLKLAALDADHAGGATFRGRLELARGRPAAAVAEFRAAERVRPSDSLLKTLIAQALLSSESGQPNEAIETLRNALEINPLNLPAHKLLYSVYEQLGDREQALTHLLAASRINPEDPFVKQRKEILDEERDPRGGVARREARRQTDPADWDNLLKLAELYLKLDDPTRAEECFKAALAVRPTDLNLVRRLAAFYVDAGRPADARDAISAYEAAAEGIDKVRAQFLLAEAAERAGDRQGAFDCLSRATELAEQVVQDPAQRTRAQVESNMELAEFCRRMNLGREMIDAYARALEHLGPQDTALRQRAMLQTIDALLQMRRLGEAEEHIQRYLKDYPAEPRGMATRAELALARDDLAGALEALNTVLANLKDTGHALYAYALYKRGAVHMDMGNYTAAKADLIESKRARPDAFDLRHRLLLATLYEITNENQLAEVELRQVVELRPDDREPADRLIRLYRRTNQLARAQEVAREIMSKQPENAFWPYTLGTLLIEREEYSAAVEPLRRALELSLRANPGAVPAVYAQLMQALIKAQRAAEAVQLFESVNPATVAPTVRTRGAEAYLAAGRTAEAMAQLERAIVEAAGTNWPTLVAVAQIARKAFPEETTLETFKRVAAQQAGQPNAAEFDAIHGMILTLMGRTSEAIPVVESALARSKPGDAWRFAVMQMKAEIVEDPQAQYAVYEQMLKENADDVVALNNIAFVLADRLNRPKEALVYANRVMELARNHPAIQDTVGWVKFLNGDLDGAERLMMESLRGDPTSPGTRFHLAKLYAARGMNARARQELERALENARAIKDTQYEKTIEQELAKLR